jgi:hypothetical protein
METYQIEKANEGKKIMSSTNRSTVRSNHDSDYYVTPKDQIKTFLDEMLKHEPIMLQGKILDPCAGGDKENDMSYPFVLKQYGVKNENIQTIDIRESSLANIKENYLLYNLEENPNLIITNPPFNLAIDIIQKSLIDVCDNGFVVMLLRLNFFGGKSRKPFWENNMPKYTLIHHKRMSFTSDKKTDSIEYAHFVWQKGHNAGFTMTKVI